MKNFRKNEIGITLIALVITVIVLLILAGVTIATLTGDNGILKRAQEAKNKTEQAQKEEQNILNSYEDKINEYAGIDWNTALANAQKHPDQKNSTAIGVGTDGRSVNMDLWEYTLLDDGTYGLNDEETVAATTGGTAGYKGEFVDGKIQGTIPQYIKEISDEEFKPVTSLKFLFRSMDLLEAPKIPDTVTNMYGTFGTTKITKMPTIPNGVTNMYGTFASCSQLTDVTYIPNSVTNMYGTFRECLSLVNAPEIPSSVSNMVSTFYGCTSLTTAPSIPDGITSMQSTFSGCTSLTVAPSIPNSVTNMRNTFEGCTALVTAPTIPSSVTALIYTFKGCSNLQGSIEINANVTGELLGEDYGNNIDYWYCLFEATTNPDISLKVTGSCPILQKIVENASNPNITLK